MGEPSPNPRLSSSARWDARADEWMEKLKKSRAYRERMDERVKTTAEFLRQNGQLGRGSRVLDIGCGPGLFAVEFARSADHVTGLDISPRMIEHARNYARQQQVENVSYLACDFKRAGLDAMGWRRRFDLVMGSLTPALTRVPDLHKLMASSRGYCLHVSFVQAKDSLKDKIYAALYRSNSERTRYEEGRVFYSIFNLLFLEGYNPITGYFKQAAEEDVVVDERLADGYAGSLAKYSPDPTIETGRIYDYLLDISKKEGCLRRRREDCYGFILWDVNERRTVNAVTQSGVGGYLQDSPKYF